METSQIQMLVSRLEGDHKIIPDVVPDEKKHWNLHGEFNGFVPRI